LIAAGRAPAHTTPILREDTSMELRLIRVWFGKMLDALRFGRAPSSAETAGPPSVWLTQNFSVTLEGIDLRGWMVFPVARPARQYPALVICHGIPAGGTPRHEGDTGYEGLAREFTSMGLVSVFFNFRGCGESGGNFDMAGWPRDLEAVLDRIFNTPHIDPDRVMILGFSGGGAAAIRVTAENSRVWGLASAAAPAGFEIFGKDEQAILDDFRARGLIKDPQFPQDLHRWIEGFREVEARRWIGHFKGKHLLIVHGDEDELVPVEHGRELFRNAPAGVAELSVIPAGIHQLRLDPRCVSVVKTWIAKILGWRKPAS
jgi:uncharacterized protein